ncbi:MAG: hypothetical protein PF572_06120 [Patescibacteria group bacterium]|jgi:putative GTP pyrophosphokinase|nr:hypothetical protein [Patescibacteria group bacterium]
MNNIDLIDQFKTERPLYEEFSVAVYYLLESILTGDGYKYQMSSRIKELEKLEEKISRKKNEGKLYSHLAEIEDIVGLRIVFYFEAEKKKFLRKIKKEISRDLKVEEQKKKSGYEAIQIIATLGEERINLSEYKKFKDLKCEIQLTSILHHAWAEIEHDLIYKNGFGINNEKQILRYKKKMKKILTNYIQKASKEFDKIFVKIKT